MGFKIKSISLYIILLSVFLLIGVLISFAIYYNYGIKKATLKDAVVYVSTGSNLSDQAALLVKEGVISDTLDYIRFARKAKYDRVYPGKYTIKKGMSLRDLNLLVSTGKQTPVKVSFNNIRTPEKLASVVSRYIESDSASMIAVLTCDSIHLKHGFDQANFLSMFIPNTYEVYWNYTPEEFVTRMKREYDRFWAKKSRQEKLKELDMTPQEVSILASIIIEESKAKQEFERIAGVYINRLKIGMPLQADPTVKFALGDPTIRRVLYSHLKVDSPYNTYKNRGLPPGVICVPPINAIESVLNYEKHELLYFCASPELNGLHLFAKTLSQHNKNAKAYASALNRRGIR